MAALDGGEALVTAVYKTVEANAGLVISPARRDYQAGHLPPDPRLGSGVTAIDGQLVDWPTCIPKNQERQNKPPCSDVLYLY